MSARLLPGVWQCGGCGRHYRLKHTSGVLAREPVSMPDYACCPNCGGVVAPKSASARVTESNIADNARVYKELVG